MSLQLRDGHWQRTPKGVAGRVEVPRSLERRMLEQDPVRQAAQDAISLQHTQEMWARRCAKRHFELVCYYANKYGLHSAAELMQGNFMDDAWRIYQVQQGLRGFASRLCKGMWVAALEQVMRGRK